MSDTAVLSDDARAERMSGLMSVIELIRPHVQQDGGDLALCGGSPVGSFHAQQSGHTLNHRMVEQLRGASQPRRKAA